MLTPKYTKQFEKDVKKMQKSGQKDMQKIKDIIRVLIDEQQLEDKHKDHKLIGNYVNHRECHIEPDWLLIYKIEDNNIIFVRTGSHSELFK